MIQLSQGKLFNPCNSRKDANAEELYATLPSSAYRQILQDVASGISRLVRKDGNMICHRGNGLFLSISHRRNSALHPGSELQLNQIVATIMARHPEPPRGEVGNW